VFFKNCPAIYALLDIAVEARGNETYLVVLTDGDIWQIPLTNPSSQGWVQVLKYFDTRSFYGSLEAGTKAAYAPDKTWWILRSPISHHIITCHLSPYLIEC
jgi:hypothetical protein